MNNYYSFFGRELPKTGIRTGELALYLGTVTKGFCAVPSNCEDRRNVYVYLWKDGSSEDLGVRFVYEEMQVDNVERGSYVLKVEVADERWVFLRNDRGDRIRQVAGPAKPVVIMNIGAETVWVDTFLGKYSVPAGTCLRLEENTPQREKKKVLLTVDGSSSEGGSSAKMSALILDGERWRPMNICAGGMMEGGSRSRGSEQILDGTFVVQTFSRLGWAKVILDDMPSDPDHEIYIRSMRDGSEGAEMHFYGVGMRDDGLGRKKQSLRFQKGIIYDLQKLRQAPTLELMEECTAELPYLEQLGTSTEEDVPWPEVPCV